MGEAGILGKQLKLNLRRFVDAFGSVSVYVYEKHAMFSHDAWNALIQHQIFFKNIQCSDKAFSVVRRKMIFSEH